MDKEGKTPIRPVLSGLAPGGQAEFPLERFASVRATAYDLSMAQGKSFTTRRDRERGTFTVTRTA